MAGNWHLRTTPRTHLKRSTWRRKCRTRCTTAANCNCCQLQLLPIATAANCNCCQLQLLPIATAANCNCCQLQLLPIATAAGADRSSGGIAASAALSSAALSTAAFSTAALSTAALSCMVVCLLQLLSGTCSLTVCVSVLGVQRSGRRNGETG